MEQPQTVKQYADYLREYNERIEPLRKARLNEAKQRRADRIRAGIDIREKQNLMNPWLTKPDLD